MRNYTNDKLEIGLQVNLFNTYKHLNALQHLKQIGR